MPSYNTVAHHRIRRILIPSTAVLILLFLIVAFWTPLGEKMKAIRIAHINSTVSQIYTKKYQQQASRDLIVKRDADTHDENHIFTAENPYGTSTTGLYVYFTTASPAKVTYRVSTPNTDYPDYSATPQGGDIRSTKHEFQVIGLVPGKTNTVTLTLSYASGAKAVKTITQHSSPAWGTEETRLTNTTGNSGRDIGSDLYAILGNDSDDQDYLFYYDSHGVLRAEIPILYYRAHRLVFDNGLMYFSASTHDIVAMNRFGKIERFLSTGKRYILHHDYALDAQGNLIVLATDTTRSTIQDVIITINTTSGKVRKLVDMGELFRSYKDSTKSATMGSSGSSTSDSTDSTSRNYNADTSTTKKDWLHLNTIQVLPDNRILVSSRETSTIIMLDHVDTSPAIEYMIGTNSFWSDSQYSRYLLTNADGASGTGGQHSVTYDADPHLPQGQYYLYLFDNNYGVSNTRPDYDWAKHVTGIQTSYANGTHSQYRKYLVNETDDSYRLESSFDVPYSPIVSSAQQLGDDTILTDSGTKGLFSVYSQSGKLLTQWKMTVMKNIVYRVYQYDFQGFYFAG